MEIFSTFGKYTVFALASFLAVSAPLDVSAEDDPTKHLKVLQCRAEFALNENNYEEAEKLADTIVSEAFDGPNNWRRGNLLHHGFRILGMVAIEKGDLKNAKGHLLNSAVTHSGSPQLNSFGPNMSLAKSLLEHGERSFVLEYLDLCRNFWDSEELANWSMEINDDKIPDFGANLNYGIDLPGSRLCPDV